MCELVKLVRKYQAHYDEQFANRSLSVVKNYTFQVPVTVDGIESQIRVSFEPTRGMHPSIWATNAVHVLEDNRKEAWIFVNPEVQGLGAVKQKAILAHEYIEVVKTFYDGNRPKAVHKREDLVLFLARLKKRTIWMDTSEERDELALATRELLVSAEAIRQVMGEFGLTSEQLKAATPAQAQEWLDRICEAFSALRSVDPQLVEDRLFELLVQGRL